VAQPVLASLRTATLAAVALTALACAPSASREQPAGLGRPVVAGPVRALLPSPDGAFLAVLDGCQEVRAQFLPPQTARCDLRVVPAGGGDATRIAAGVTTLPQGVAWSPDGRTLVAMSDYDHAGASATLVRWSPGEAPRTVGERVTFHGFGPRGELGFVAGGRLSVMLPGDAAPRPVAGADGIASFDLSPQEFPACPPRPGPALRLVARRAQAAGGQLLGAGCALDRLQPLEAGQVGDYGFARATPVLAYTVIRRDGTALRLVDAERGGTHDLGRGAQAFAFGPDGRTLAFVADLVPGKQGNLHLGGASRKDQILARDVGEFRWAAAAPRLAWLEKYDPRVRSGVLGAGGPDLAPRTVAQNVTDLELSRDGERLAFLQHTTRGGYSVDLGLAAVGAAAEKPVTVAQGVFGFGFSPDGKWLYYRTRCVRNGEACDLERVPAAGLAPGAKPEAVAPGVKSFEFDPRDPERLLVTWQRADLVALDVGVWSPGKLVKVDQGILPGSARFLGPDSRRMAYVVVQPKRQGAYVAEVAK
jgi:sugar lactone lactonase YvrE